mgnify:CR=1 FL=1
MRKHRLFLVVLAGLLVLGTLFAGAVAAQAPAPDDNSDGVEAPGGGILGRWFGRAMGRGCGLGGRVGRHLGETASMVDAVAEVTGLTADEVREALADGQSLTDILSANGATVEEAVDAFIAGRVGALQGARDDLIERVEQGTPGVGGFMGPFADGSLLEVIVDLTDYDSVADVQAALSEGLSLEEAITEGGSTVDEVVSEFLARREAALDELVADGRLTQEQADAMIEHMDEEISEHIEEGFIGCPGGFGPGVGPGGMMRGQRGGPGGGFRGNGQGIGVGRGVRFNGTGI